MSIRSVLQQSVDDFEIVVVDDASESNIFSVSHDKRIKIVRHEYNLGAASARNTGIKIAAGKYIAFLDSDDLWLKDKLRIQLNFMKSAAYRASCTGYVFRQHGSKKEVVRNHSTEEKRLQDIVWGCYLSPGSTLLVEREVFDRIGLMDITFRRYEDWDWLVRFCMHYKIGCVRDELSIIQASGIMNEDHVSSGLELMSSKHLELLGESDSRNMRAGIMMEKAAINFRNQNFVKCFFWIVRSLFLSPVNNIAFRYVVLSRWAA